jgi:hypothetical protein
MYKLTELMAVLDDYVEQLWYIYKMLDWQWYGNKNNKEGMSVPSKEDIKHSIIQNIEHLSTHKDSVIASGGIQVSKELSDKEWYYTVEFIYALVGKEEEESND